MCEVPGEREVGGREERLGAPEIPAGRNGSQEIGDQHRGQREDAVGEGSENPQAAKLSYWMVRAAKGGESRGRGETGLLNITQ